jgi:hypothetical protein
MALLRRVSTVALAGLSLLLFVSPQAQAKALSVDRVTVRGPGLDEPLFLAAKEWGIPRNENSPTARIVEGLLGRFAKVKSSPNGVLGPGYKLQYRLMVLDVRTKGFRYETITQRLHPFAERGPVTFTPSDQTWMSPTGDPLRIEVGWQEFPRVQVRRLQRLGLPYSAPASPTGAPSQTVIPWSLLWSALAAGVAALVLTRFRARAARGRPVGLLWAAGPSGLDSPLWGWRSSTSMRSRTGWRP